MTVSLLALVEIPFGSAADWAMVILTIGTTLLIYSTLQSQTETLRLQMKMFEREFYRNNDAVLPDFECLIMQSNPDSDLERHHNFTCYLVPNGKSYRNLKYRFKDTHTNFTLFAPTQNEIIRDSAIRIFFKAIPIGRARIYCHLWIMFEDIIGDEYEIRYAIGKESSPREKIGPFKKGIIADSLRHEFNDNALVLYENSKIQQQNYTPYEGPLSTNAFERN